MRRHRLNPLTGLFFNTGDRHEPTIDESFGFSRQYRDTVSEGLMEDERLENKKEAAAKQAAQTQPKPLEQPKNEFPDAHQTCL